MGATSTHPDYGPFMAQVKTYRRFYGNWPEGLHRSLERAWRIIREGLDQAKHPWQVAKGPVAAFICFLLEHQWECSSYMENGSNLATMEVEISTST